LSLIIFIFPPLLLENLVIKIFWQINFYASCHFQPILQLRSIVSDEVGFSEPSAEEVPQEVNDDRNESREER